ncbi:MAG: hypothetical protein ACI81L_001067 [Verrucomicrobiales bacterium]|jgi:hypothetical protein
MTRRLLPLILLIGLVASACSSGLVPSSTNDEDPSTNDSNPSDDGQSRTAPDAPDTTGGAQFDRSSADVIIEAQPDHGALAQYPWPTDWTRRTVEDWNEFQPGLRSRDPRDGIPPIDGPIFETTALAGEWIGPREPGALVQVDGEARFYPLSILTRHEIVNDTFGDVPVAVTFCPLCNTAIAFDRRINGAVLRFGVSGLLRNSDLVMWDSATTSLWQQITGEGVVGEYAGAKLDSVATSIVSFSQFAEQFPDGKSLSGEGGFGRRAYGVNPYSNYSSSDRPFLFNDEIDDRLPALSRVVGVTEGDGLASYSFARLETERAINDIVGDQPVVVLFAGDTADALDDRAIATSQAIGSGVAHSSVVDGETLTFAANSDGSFTDAETNSTWSILGIATDGELVGTQLEPVQHRNEFWFAWQAFFGPESLREA